MTRLWLTYAWKDNDESDVDHVIAELRASGLDVRYDRVELLAGRRLWDQIDAGINDPKTAAWAIYVTRASLESEPCQEELAYALDRALRTRGSTFPLIGIFPDSLDRSLIPSALATRLYVNLRDPEWKEQIVSGVRGSRAESVAMPPEPFRWTVHQFNGRPVVEVWPRTGRWCPFVAAVPRGGRSQIQAVIPGPRGHITGTGVVSGGDASSPDGKLTGKAVDSAIDALTSAHIFLNELPSEIHFGQAGGPAFRLALQAAF